MESRKIVLMNLFPGQQWRCRHREQTYGHRLGRAEEGEGEMNRESSMEADTLTYLKEIASGNLLYASGNTNLGPVTT